MENKPGKLESTGERYLPEVDGEVQLEHLHRYALAQGLAVDKLVLDIASGEGYGSSMLSDVAEQVTGVDISDDAVIHASTKYQRENLRFLQGSCAEIPLDDNSVDLVISFETIEHHDQHEEMMVEIKRVLKVGGLLIISSPNKYEYSDVPQYNNEFHVKELYRDEFEDLLGRYFSNIALLNQRVTYGSAIISNKPITTLSTFNQSESEVLCVQGLPRPMYDIAIATDSEIPSVGSSIFEGNIKTITLPYEKHIAHLVQTIESVVEDRDAKETGIEIVVNERDVLQARLENDLSGLQEKILSNEAAFELQRDEVEQLKQEQQVVKSTYETKIDELERLTKKYLESSDEHQEHISKLGETLNSLIVDRDAWKKEAELLQHKASTCDVEREALLSEIETLRNKS